MFISMVRLVIKNRSNIFLKILKCIYNVKNASKSIKPTNNAKSASKNVWTYKMVYLKHIFSLESNV